MVRALNGAVLEFNDLYDIVQRCILCHWADISGSSLILREQQSAGKIHVGWPIFPLRSVSQSVSAEVTFYHRLWSLPILNHYWGYRAKTISSLGCTINLGVGSLWPCQLANVYSTWSTYISKTFEPKAQCLCKIIIYFSAVFLQSLTCTNVFNVTISGSSVARWRVGNMTLSGTVHGRHDLHWK